MRESPLQGSPSEGCADTVARLRARHGGSYLWYGCGHGTVVPVGAGLVFGDVNAILPTRILDGKNVSLVIQFVQQYRREGFVQVGRYEFVLGIERKISEPELNLLEVVGKEVELTYQAMDS